MTKENSIEVNKVIRLAKNNKEKGLRTPRIIVIDGKKKASASNRK